MIEDFRSDNGEHPLTNRRGAGNHYGLIVLLARNRDTSSDGDLDNAKLTHQECVQVSDHENS